MAHREAASDPLNLFRPGLCGPVEIIIKASGGYGTERERNKHLKSATTNSDEALYPGHESSNMDWTAESSRPKLSSPSCSFLSLNISAALTLSIEWQQVKQRFENDLQPSVLFLSNPLAAL